MKTTIRVCKDCGITFDQALVRRGYGGLRCKDCERIQMAAEHEAHREEDNARCLARSRNNPELVLWEQARKRAKKKGLPFEIEITDVVIPAICPVLGIPLSMGVGQHHDGSPSLDQLIPGGGYVKGYSPVISLRANVIKNDGTAEEHRKVAKFIEQQLRAAARLLKSHAKTNIHLAS